MRTHRKIGRVLGGIIVLIVVGYVPLAFTSMWFTVAPGFPRGHEVLDAWIAGHDYAWGPGSVAAVRTSAYRAYREALLVHTTLGSVALTLAVVQAGVTRRGGTAARFPHRWVGRAYAGTVLVSMAACIVFLAGAPRVPVPGQTAFHLQLWVLALSTSGAVTTGVLAMRRGQQASHAAWMALSVCFLLTAPLLRAIWAVLGALIPENTMLTNMESGAVALAVIAPARGRPLQIAASRTCAPQRRSSPSATLQARPCRAARPCEETVTNEQ